MEDPAKLNIKNLLAQSRAPVSPRSRNSTTPTSSLTSAVIASVLQQQQPVEMVLVQQQPPKQQQAPPQPPQQASRPVSVTLVSASAPKTTSAMSVAGPLNLSSVTSPSSAVPTGPSLTVTPVTITPTLSGDVAVTGGLQDGQEIVISGANMLEDGATVRRFTGFAK